MRGDRIQLATLAQAGRSGQVNALTGEVHATIGLYDQEFGLAPA